MMNENMKSDNEKTRDIIFIIFLMILVCLRIWRVREIYIKLWRVSCIHRLKKHTSPKRKSPFSPFDELYDGIIF